MSAIEIIRGYQGELTAIRRDFHEHPEIGMEEVRTADIVAKLLASWGVEVHRGVGKTGVIGVLKRGEGKRIGLRADMDCLPMDEQTNLPYRSKTPGKMHACGHDGHTTMLLGAARYLAQSKTFKGTVNFIFQPGEEGMGGALAMLGDKMFERFPCDEIYALHNRPNMPLGQFAIRKGPSMAGGAFFDIKITGLGSHGARPEAGIDPVLVAAHVTTALQSIVSRNIKPIETAVISVTRIVSGDAYNVIPQTATLSGTARAFSNDVMKAMETNMRRIAMGVSQGFGATAEVDYRLIFAPLINSANETDALADAAASIVGEANVERNKEPAMGSEDFSFMMEKVPGAYIQVGNGPSADLHNPAYNFNDDCIPFGAAMFATLVERRLS